MTSQFDDNICNNKSYFHQLQYLGWSSFFQQQLPVLSAGVSPARIVGVRKNIYLANCGQGEVQATLAGRFYHETGVQFPAVGDWVLIRDSVITSVLTRKNVLSRKAAGGRGGKSGEAHLDDQVLAANLDTVFIVCGLDRDYNLRRIERYLALVYNCAIEPVVILTKADLHLFPDDFVADVESIACGVPVIAVAVGDDESIRRVAEMLPQSRTAALIGSSGAGKSTLINRLFSEEKRETAAVGARVGKGRHTTTTRDLFILPSGGIVIDNPGIREIAIAVHDSGLESAFPDIDALARFCRFSDCSHTHEPGCRVLEAVNSGEISCGRLGNYQKIMNERSYFQARESKSAARVEKERWKDISLKVRNIKKKRDR